MCCDGRVSRDRRRGSATQFGPDRTGGVSKRGLLAAVNVAREAHSGKRITLWFQDEARIGRKDRVCHRWWRRGERPLGLCDRRYTCVSVRRRPSDNRRARFALIMPEVSTEAMNLFLAAFSKQWAADEHALISLDQAGWYGVKASVSPLGDVPLVVEIARSALPALSL